MLLLPDLRIRNYRLFEDFALERLARVNLIAGRNNVGKSALLEAAYLVGSQDPYGALLRILGERGERAEGSKEGLLSALFLHYRLTPESRIEIHAGSRWFRLCSDPDERTLKRILAESETDKEIVLLLRLETSAENQPFHLPVNAEGMAEVIRPPRRWGYTPDRTFWIRGAVSLYHRYKELSTWWDEIALTPQADLVIEILRIIEPGLQAIDFLSRRENVKVRLAGMGQPIFIGSLGDGLQHLLMIAVALAKATEGLLLLDEVETGLHFSVLVDLWRLLFRAARQRDVQVIATTHSGDCIAAFCQVWSEVEEHDGAYYRLDRVDNRILPEHYSLEELRLAVEGGIETR